MILQFLEGIEHARERTTMASASLVQPEHHAQRAAFFVGQPRPSPDVGLNCVDEHAYSGFRRAPAAAFSSSRTSSGRRINSEEPRVRIHLMAVSSTCSIHRGSVWEFDCSSNQRVFAGPLPKMSNGLIVSEVDDEDDGTCKE